MKPTIIRDRDLVGATPETLARALLNNLGCYLVAVVVFHSNHGCFTGRSTSSIGYLFALGLAHVLALAAKVSLIYLDRAVERSAVLARPRFPDTVEHEPSCRLRHADIPMKFHARNAFEAGEAQIDGNGPLSKRNLGVGHDRSGLDAEISATIGAPVRHAVAAIALVSARTAAVPAVPLTTPENAFKPCCRRNFVGKHVHQFNERDTFSVRFSWCFVCHFEVPYRVSYIWESKLQWQAFFISP